ncbi:MAG: 3-hydroxyacyl-CoA dehydrogenase NAD-binding domain-containing protein [Methyloversatilis sp.]|uniref:3-hydroxyacyl-CoA dehydrogenase/enoyl-CoA hydratase family protein n=1 Tax=Methyloversatilis sp. TaxID=2569862 RepID=UPI002734F735|nr:3-hydroxyacyl-CoA dehydrogenase NAD-binding domain-containing protein [Methyloversatilis sp.]MDP3872492.1 3-hydroxyacyl-CoA dehydrogenase NAD-binding domain-containing protein [Methyloversatilis sp.]
MSRPIALQFRIRRVAVLGAGVMGAQIAAHCANANVSVVLFDLAAKEGDPDGIVKRALDGLKKLEPAPLATADRLALIDIANYDRDLARLGECDLVIEAIAERMDWKHGLYAKVAPHLRADAIFASNTSGLSINALADGCPDSLRSRFCGVHFFNPPRYMSLVELIPSRSTDAALLDALETFLTTTLGKSVVRALDTPNFVANRVGVFSMLAAMHHTERLGLGFDEVDALTGPAIGRPKSATYRTADVVGLDTLLHVVKTMTDNLPADPWHRYYTAPAWLAALVGQGALGQKTKAGVYRKDGRQIKVLDLATQDYRDSAGAVAEEVQVILAERDPQMKLAALRASAHPQAQFLWSVFRDVFHYVAFHLADIAHTARDVDFAMRWGFGWQTGPFETWQAAGWQQVSGWLRDDIAAGRTMSDAPLPAWVFERHAAHEAAGSWSASAAALQPRASLPAHARQLFPELVLGEMPRATHTIWEGDEVRLWTLDDADGARAPVLSFKSRMSAIGPKVLEGVREAIARAERDFDALVIWQPQGPFSVGANLKQIRPVLEAGDFKALDGVINDFQQASQAIKHAQIPVITAVQNMALGGGCEFVMHSPRAVVALESYIGLVEAGVGLIPAGGGCKEFALRAARAAEASATKDPMNFLQSVFQTIAMAQVSKSARHAQELGLLKPDDVVVMHAHELLHVARRNAVAMADSAWRPALQASNIMVAGRSGIATLEMMLVNMREGGLISAHDYRVARAAAVALCGGEIETGSRVSEQWLLEVERAEFVALLRTPETQARIAHMMDTGKPLRN